MTTRERVERLIHKSALARVEWYLNDDEYLSAFWERWQRRREVPSGKHIQVILIRASPPGEQGLVAR